MSNPNEPDELAVRAAQIMRSGMEMVDLFVNKNYLINMSRCEPVEMEPWQKSFAYLSLFEISKIVYDESENINDKLVSIYSALSNFGSTALLVLFSDPGGVRFYLGTRDTRQPNVARAILQKSLRGNFPGIEIREQESARVEALMEGRIPAQYANMAVSAVSIVPGVRDEDKNRFVQGLEKFIDSMSGETYTAVFIASPLGKAELERKKRGYEDLYTALSQCAQVNLTYGENDSESVAAGMSDSFSQAVNEGISDTAGENSGMNTGVNYSHSHGSSFSFFGLGHNSGAGRGSSKGTYSGSSTGHTATRSDTETTGKTTSTTTTTTRGNTSTLAVTRQNKTVQELLKKIDEQLDRIKSCEAYGLWNSACYFIANNTEVSLVAANTYKALVAGEQTSVENSFINLWGNEYENAAKSLTVLDYLRYGVHPRFTYHPPQAEAGYSAQTVTPASLISGVELPILMGVPRKSVSGVTSIVSAEFGRNVFTRESEGNRRVDIGAIYHMGEVFPHNRVSLDVESLSAHCFITGSTGSGKSNTTYKILDELIAQRNHVRFLVIEPAKGEYKLAFGGLPGIHIFTTNPKYYEMLGLNPFAFPEKVHVLEHLDRLIEIFSACWPLYAAMPALLKAAFERAYVNHGWDLNHSLYINKGNGRYPTFGDIVRILPRLLGESQFSAETKGDYIGSLVTRVESLTNGLLGQIFVSDGVPDEVLFDENTVVDLSRIGSAETKALLMGVLILKLGEYRQSASSGTNLPIRHVTVLEEAHNLLKRTSTEQGQESANLQGKSVEMISNSIAEMRTYGEGFLIVDQSPSAVDISAIKNTNTKIIMRLPEAGDGEAVGRSIGLSNAQIAQLSRLDKGVAVIYQNNWLEAVLAKIDRSSATYEVSAAKVRDRKPRLALVGDLLAELIEQDKTGEFNLSWLNPIVDGADVPEFVKTRCRHLLWDYQKKRQTGMRKLAFARLLLDLMNCDGLYRMFEEELPPMIRKKSELTDDVRAQCMRWKRCICDHLAEYADFYDEPTREAVFIQTLLAKISRETDNRRYKLALLCVGRRAKPA